MNLATTSRDGWRRTCRGVALAGALIVGWSCGRHLIGTPTLVLGPSMSPTLADRQWVRIRALYRWQRIERGDLVTLQDHNSRVVKRVIGLPGDRIELRMGYVYLDGKQLQEAYIPTNILTAAGSAGGVLTPGQAQCIVMGDNRWESRDSRDYGPVQRGYICGRVVVPAVRRD